MQYKEWLGEWLSSSVRPVVKERTAEAYEYAVRRQIVPTLGDYALDELSPLVLQRFAAGLCARYAPNTVRGVVGVLRASLLRAEQTGVVARQFGATIRLPHGREKEVACFTVTEQKQIEAYALRHRNRKFAGFVLCLYTGLRVGELLALTWQDVDFAAGTLRVNKSCRDRWGGGYRKRIDTPKTAHSHRVIPLPAALLPLLTALRSHSKSAYVVSDANGHDVSVRSYQRSFESMLRKLCIKHRGVHALRHTFATRALECGMDARTLAEVLGHKNPAVTLSRYAHSLQEHKSAMMDRLGELL